MELIRSFADNYLAHVPSLRITDIVEIIIISFVVYHIMVWIKNTKAWVFREGRDFHHGLHSHCGYF